MILKINTGDVAATAPSEPRSGKRGFLPHPGSQARGTPFARDGPGQVMRPTNQPTSVQSINRVPKINLPVIGKLHPYKSNWAQHPAPEWDEQRLWIRARGAVRRPNRRSLAGGLRVRGSGGLTRTEYRLWWSRATVSAAARAACVAPSPCVASGSTGGPRVRGSGCALGERRHRRSARETTGCTYAAVFSRIKISYDFTNLTFTESKYLIYNRYWSHHIWYWSYQYGSSINTFFPCTPIFRPFDILRWTAPIFLTTINFS